MKKILLSAAMLTAVLATAQNTGIGTTNPQEKLDVIGSVRAAGDLILQPLTTSKDAGDIIFRNGPTATVPNKIIGRVWSNVATSGLNLAGHDYANAPYTTDTALSSPDMSISSTGEVAIYQVKQNDAATNVLVYGADGILGRKPISALSTAYTSSLSNILNGTTFERAALTGDVTAAQNSNATTIAPNAVTSAKIADGTIAAADLSSMGAANGQVMKWNGTQWVPSADTNTTYTGSTSVVANGTSFERAALTGDVTSAQNSNATVIAPNAVTSAKIADGTIAAADLSAMGATAAGQNLTWNGSAWVPTTPAAPTVTGVQNGLSMNGTLAELGGTLTKGTTIVGSATNSLNIQNSNLNLNETGLNLNSATADAPDMMFNSSKGAIGRMWTNPNGYGLNLTSHNPASFENDTVQAVPDFSIKPTGEVVLTTVNKDNALNSVLVRGADGTVKYRDASSLYTPTTAQNGLSMNGTAVELGGTLSKDTSIATANNGLSFTGFTTKGLGINKNASGGYLLDVAGPGRLNGDLVFQAIGTTDSGDIVFQNSATAPTPNKTIGRIFTPSNGDGGLYLTGHDSSTAPFTTDTVLAQPDLIIKKTGEVALAHIANNPTSQNMLVAGADGTIGYTSVAAVVGSASAWNNLDTANPSVSVTDPIYHLNDVAIASPNPSGTDFSGSKLSFGVDNAETQTDPIMVYRHNYSPDISELRVAVGDNPANSAYQDFFTVGITPTGTSDFVPRFKVNSVTGAAQVGSGESKDIGTTTILPGSGSITSRLTYGTDNTGYKFSIAKNYNNTLTDQLTVADNGNVGISASNTPAKFSIYNNLTGNPLMSVTTDNSNGGAMDDIFISSYGTPYITFGMAASRGTSTAPANLQINDPIYNLMGIGQVNGAQKVLTNFNMVYRGDGTTPLTSTDIVNSGSIAMYIAPNNNVGVGTVSTSQKLTVAGNVQANNAVFTNLPVYATDAAADADTALSSGSLYKLSSSGRQVFVKP